MLINLKSKVINNVELNHLNKESFAKVHNARCVSLIN